MYKKQSHTSLKYIVAAVVAVVMLFVTLANSGGLSVQAAALTYSEVLDDLKTDSNFDAAKYPYKADDYSLNVIQVAESTDGELLIYVYQPSGLNKNLRASSINIARSRDNTTELSFKNYFLKFQAASGVIFKYAVLDFAIEEAAIRYYNISNILRPFDEMIDKAPTGSNTSSKVKNRVGQLWTACTVDGKVTYSMTASEVIEITDKFVGYFDYFDGQSPSAGWDALIGKLNLNATHTMRNFVAFSTDRPIDRLIKAELQYSLQDYSYKLCANPICASSAHPYAKTYDHKKGDMVQQDPVIIEAGKKISNNAHGIAGNSYEWKSIQTTAEFLVGADSGAYELSEEGKGSIEDTQWVLNFKDVVFTMTGKVGLFDDSQIDVNGEIVSNVIILRLTFEKDGEVFNLGTVDNKQTSSEKSVNVSKPSEGKLSWWQIALIVIAAVLVVIVVILILCKVFPVVGTVVGGIFKGVWFVISAPFKLIAKAVEKRKQKRENGEKRTKRKAKKNTGKGNEGEQNGKGKKKPATSKRQGGTKTIKTNDVGAGKRGRKK